MSEEIKAISKNYFSEQIEFDYEMPGSRVPVTFIAYNGKLYMDTEEPAKVLGTSNMQK